MGVMFGALADVIDKSEITVAYLSKLQGFCVGDTHDFQGIIEDAALYVPVGCAINLYFTADPFVCGRCIEVGEMSDGNF